MALISVDGADGCNIMGNILGAALEDLEIGKEVRVAFEAVTNEVTGEELKIPQWRLVV